MLEWLKRCAWKAHKRQKRFGGSNPPRSANIPPKKINMALEIRHKRLYAFYNSRVLSILMCIAEALLCLMAYSGSMQWFGIPMGLVLLLMVGYTAWLWIKKPAQIVIDKWLAGVTIYPFVLFGIIEIADPENSIWYLVPCALACIFLIASLFKNTTDRYEISRI